MYHDLLTIPQQEWDIAEAFFQQSPGLQKLRRKLGYTTHSFIRVGDKIVAMADETLGEGGFGRVKVAQDKEGYNYAVKIEGKMYDRTQELKAMELQGTLVGVMERKYTGKKLLKGDNPDKKTYTLQTLFLEGTLAAALEKSPSIEERHALALAGARALKELHDNNMVHSDLKPENMVLAHDSEGSEQVLVRLIDFSGAKILLHKDASAPVSIFTYGYEDATVRSGFVNRKTDLYAFGKVLARMGIHKDLVEKMTAENQDQRPTLEAVIAELERSVVLPEVKVTQPIPGFVGYMWGRETPDTSDTESLIPEFAAMSLGAR